jgi:hypothetical protein
VKACFLIKFTADEVPRRFKTIIALINLGERIVDIQEVWKAFKNALRGQINHRGGVG